MNPAKRHLTLKIFALIVLNDLGDTLAQLLMKKGLAQAGPVTPGGIMDFCAVDVSSPLLWIGVIVQVLNFFIWIVILYKVDLSIAMPAGSTSYLFIPIAAALFLGEHISALRWAGIILIVLGIHFVSQSTKEAPPGAVEAGPC
jgi:drug/metabolite transporter (DMT)-like permease